MNKFLRLHLFINSINIVADYLLIPIFALFIASVGDNAELAGILFAVKFISSAAFGLSIVRVKDHIGLSSKFLEASYLMKGLGWSIIAFSQNVPTLIVVQIILGAATAIGLPANQTIISEHLDKNRHISDWDITELSHNISVALGSVLSGILFTAFGFTSLFLLMMSLEFIAFALCRFNKK